LEGFLSVKEVLKKYIEGCRAKVEMSSNQLFGKAILAGAMIAILDFLLQYGIDFLTTL